MNVEVSVVLSLREGGFLRICMWRGTKSELVDSCEGVVSEGSSKRFDREIDGFLRGFNGRYVFNIVLLLDSDGSCIEGTGG